MKNRVNTFVRIITGDHHSPVQFASPGPKPGNPRNLTVTEISNGFLITWQPPSNRTHLIQYYTIKYKTDGPWKTLNKGQIRPEETSYLGEKDTHPCAPSLCRLLSNTRISDGAILASCRHFS